MAVYKYNHIVCLIAIGLYGGLAQALSREGEIMLEGKVRPARRDQDDLQRRSINILLSLWLAMIARVVRTLEMRRDSPRFWLFALRERCRDVEV